MSRLLVRLALVVLFGLLCLPAGPGWALAGFLAALVLALRVDRPRPRAAERPEEWRDPVRDFPEDVRARVLAEAGGRCFYCWLEGRTVIVHHEGDCPDGECPKDYQTDHAVPWSRGGPTIYENAICSCRRHNGAEGNRTLVEDVPLLLAAARAQR